MGNQALGKDSLCAPCNQIFQQTKEQATKVKPSFQQQNPFAIPLELNPYRHSAETQSQIQKILLAQALSRPLHFNPKSITYSQKYWKKQNLDLIIQGQWCDRIPHGLVRIYFKTGEVFSSYFNMGHVCWTDVILVFNNLDYYRGQMNNTNFQGKGKYVVKDKLYYQGQWLNNIPIGHGKQVFIQDKDMSHTYQGQFNSQGQKQDKNAKYTIKTPKLIFQYTGGFKENSFSGTGQIKSNQRPILQGQFNNQSDFIQITSFSVDKYKFQGNIQRDFMKGQGKLKIIGGEKQFIGKLVNGMLNGPGQILTNQIQHPREDVYWFQGIKLKLLKNFDDLPELRNLLKHIQSQFKVSNKYSQMIKSLLKYYSAKPMDQNQVYYPNNYQFQMLNQQKLKDVLRAHMKNGSRIKSKSNISLAHVGNSKQLIVQLGKKKYLYMYEPKLKQPIIRQSLQVPQEKV